MDSMEVRCSANYHSTFWDIDSIRALLARSNCTAAAIVDFLHICGWLQALSHDHHKRLKETVQRRLQDITQPHHLLGLIDAVQRLGVAYRFEVEISDALDGLHSENTKHAIKDSLHHTSLYFRLLRQHGCNLSSDIFNKFKKEGGGFKASLCEDAMGLLSMYEAAHLGVKGEAILEEAQVFSTANLKILMERVERKLADRIEHALEIPLYWRASRPEARWYIDAYEKEDGRIDDLVDFAKLDFNMVQMVYQTELEELSMWWELLGLPEKMGFFRDRLMENYLLAIGMVVEPQYSQCRIAITKAIVLITVMDDFYDVHGLPDELKVFTDIVNRWDLEGIDQLPEYMKLYYLALYNTTNETAYIILKEKGFNATHYLKKLWAMQSNSYFREAQWFNSGYTPKFDEYLDNALVSVGVPLVLGLSYPMIQQQISKAEIDLIPEDLNLLRWASIIFRLYNDLATSKAEQQRGDVPKSIQCYMHETGSSEEVARNHIRDLISDAWKELNAECLKPTSLSKHYVGVAPNSARSGVLMYHHDFDGIADPRSRTNAHITSIFFEPVALKESINLG
ncbi:alpha-terpineol synthase isoform X2 [Cinnamomum micranthum f. kanehirae]|uniref:Alpha-terpineol synthase isoform X2 n=1 Tax=Cinnamomum micranthum f. kanehirae TaxID=337451 RepID=A0A443NFI4_9MAGN|nr:alpha-terpineol synthase isoform X2 [Cinnamomum micranthum f. kanehirae]